MRRILVAEAEAAAGGVVSTGDLETMDGLMPEDGRLPLSYLPSSSKKKMNGQSQMRTINWEAA